MEIDFENSFGINFSILKKSSDVLKTIPLCVDDVDVSYWMGDGPCLHVEDGPKLCAGMVFRGMFPSYVGYFSIGVVFP